MNKLLLSLSLIFAMQLTTSEAYAEPPRVRTARHHAFRDFREHFGKPVFIRIIKEERVLELWVQDKDGEWEILTTYDIAGMSGDLGPKTKQGDRQAPEGFYRLTRRSLNPRSQYHLGMNVGYPNRYDRAHRRTGGLIMIHGSNVSIGCFAMTDRKIEESYTLVNEAFKAGVQDVPVQIYPFRMTESRMRKERNNKHFSFWQHLQPGYLYTEDKDAPYPSNDC